MMMTMINYGECQCCGWEMKREWVRAREESREWEWRNLTDGLDHINHVVVIQTLRSATLWKNQTSYYYTHTRQNLRPHLTRTEKKRRAGGSLSLNTLWSDVNDPKRMPKKSQDIIDIVSRMVTGIMSQSINDECMFRKHGPNIIRMKNSSARFVLIL